MNGEFFPDPVDWTASDLLALAAELLPPEEATLAEPCICIIGPDRGVEALFDGEHVNRALDTLRRLGLAKPAVMRHRLALARVMMLAVTLGWTPKDADA